MTPRYWYRGKSIQHAARPQMLPALVRFRGPLENPSGLGPPRTGEFDPNQPLHVRVTSRSYMRMRICSPIVALMAALAFLLSWRTGAQAGECDLLKANVPTIIWPAPQDVTYSPYGYNYPYLLYVPAKAPAGDFSFLIVESNNPGTAGFNAGELLNLAIEQTVRADLSLGRSLADRLGYPLLMPVFPRPLSQNANGNVYTHSLSREAMLIASGPLYRMDLQLIAMAEEAKAKLAGCGLKLADKIMIDGFSASGVFAGRFVFLHPDLVAGSAFGGVCGFLSLPAAEFKGHNLNYPLGAADYARFTGRPFDKAAFDAVPQFAFTGSEDVEPERDCVGKRDAYSDEETATIYDILGNGKVPARFKQTEEAYRSLGSSAKFVTYNGVAHAWYESPAVDDITPFFEAVANKICPSCGRHRGSDEQK